MAYHQEGTDIVIDGWQNGIADSPYEGLAEVSYGQVVNFPGEITAMGPLAAATKTGATMDMPVAKAVQRVDGDGTITDFYVLDARGRVWSAGPTAQEWTFEAAAGSTAVAIVGDSGMFFWKGYLFVFRGNKVYYNTGSGAFTDWSTAAVGTITGGVTHYAFVGTDDVLYFCNGSGVGSIIENAGSTFDPGTASTYTFNAQALAIPTNEMATCLEQLGPNLLVGTSLNKIYPWDRISPSFNTPLFIGENFTFRMVTVNTNTYIFPSHPTINNGRGYIYVTNGSQVDIFKKMPDSFNATIGSFSPEPYWLFGDAMYHRNKIFFGAKSADGTGGVWCLDLNTKNLFRANLPSPGANYYALVINPVYTGGSGVTPPLGYGYFVGTGVAGTFGDMDYTTNTLSTSYVAISDKIPVGTFLGQQTFDNVEVKLATALVSGETLTVEYIDDSGTGTIGTFTSSDGGVGKVFPVTFQNSQWLQIKVTGAPTNTTPSYVRLKEIRLRKQKTSV